ncbi:AMP-binding protein [Spongiivirga citrea]|uniref:AMP-binding protein n=1 Tax=Spongiivirga citrea TaxID=1481457 RepID=A0A6M0CHU9_9FLAO|nr:AMP-binding protein [Spongiivirga citrea]NER17445.1 AMP-binding protein [Spongiivirga citrea]
MTKFNSILDAFTHWETTTADAIFLNQPVNGKNVPYSFYKAGQEARKIAARLQSYNLPEKSHIALLSKNCAHWMISDIAIMMAGYVSVPIYPTLNAESVNQILVHSDARAIIIGKLDNYEAQRSGIPDIHKISIELYNNNEGESWEQIVDTTAPLIKTNEAKKDDLLTIIYTSGTTGTPKGVMHSVGNFIESVTTLADFFNIPKQAKQFSYLPSAHIAERIGGLVGVINGANIFFPESLETFASDLAKTQPDTFGSVPRILDKFQEKILEKIPQKKLSRLLKIPVINTIVKNKLKEKLGLKNAKTIICGAAPVAASTIKWYKKIGLDILQMYGMTEDCIVSHANLHHANKIGSAGKALPGVTRKLSAEGEILIKNNCLMKGYYKSPELTAEVFTEDGFIRTGDIGEFDHDGFLNITGRAKDKFKTDKGKYISPATIEKLLTGNPNVEMRCVVGTGIPQPILLVTLSETGRKQDRVGLSKSLLDDISSVNPILEKHERIQKIIVMKEDWTVDNGLVTPSLKIKRNAIEKIHEPYYKQWFEKEEAVLFE